MVLLLTGLTLLGLIASVLPLLRHTHWLVRGMDFPRLQIAVFLGALWVAQLGFLEHTSGAFWLLTLPTALCFIGQLWWVLPYTVLWPKEVKDAASLKQAKAMHSAAHAESLCILTANVLTPNRQSDALIEQVNARRPDVLVTLESDQWWQDQLSVLETDMPYSVKCPLDNLYGMHLYSRLPLEAVDIRYLVEPHVPSIHAAVRLASGACIRLHCVHPAPPSPTENPESAERDAELVLIAKSVAQSDQPVIVTGDLNDVAWSATTRLFRRISGLLDPRVGRGMFNTFHADFPFLRWPLDHVFHTHHFQVRSIECLPPIGSDHFALLTELEYVPEQRDDQQGLRPDAEHHAWADEIVKQKGVSAQTVPEPRES